MLFSGEIRVCSVRTCANQDATTAVAVALAFGVGVPLA
jgi:hypothetical protein